MFPSVLEASQITAMTVVPPEAAFVVVTVIEVIPLAEFVQYSKSDEPSPEPLAVLFVACVHEALQEPEDTRLAEAIEFPVFPSTIPATSKCPLPVDVNDTAQLLPLVNVQSLTCVRLHVAQQGVVASRSKNVNSRFTDCTPQRRRLSLCRGQTVCQRQFDFELQTELFEIPVQSVPVYRWKRSST